MNIYRQNSIKALYMRMPGASTPPKDDEGFYMWDEVVHNDHWAFCETIVDLIELSDRTKPPVAGRR